MTAEGRATHYPAPTLMSDLNDEVCRICWQGVRVSLCDGRRRITSVMHLLCEGHPLVSVLSLDVQGQTFMHFMSSVRRAMSDTREHPARAHSGAHSRQSST